MRIYEWEPERALVIGVVAESMKTLMEVQTQLLMMNSREIRRWRRGTMIHLVDGTRIYFVLSGDPASIKANRFDEIWLCGTQSEEFWENVRMTERVPEEWNVQYLRV